MGAASRPWQQLCGWASGVRHTAGHTGLRGEQVRMPTSTASLPLPLHPLQPILSFLTASAVVSAAGKEQHVLTVQAQCPDRRHLRTDLDTCSGAAEGEHRPGCGARRAPRRHRALRGPRPPRSARSVSRGAEPRRALFVCAEAHPHAQGESPGARWGVDEGARPCEAPCAGAAGAGAQPALRRSQEPSRGSERQSACTGAADTRHPACAWGCAL